MASLPVRYACSAAAACGLLLVGAPAMAQEDDPVALAWTRGPGVMPIGPGIAEIELGESHIFLDAAGTRQLMELTQNPVSGMELATVASTNEGDSWFLVFEFDDVGYVSDQEKDSLDADAMLASIREGTEAGNEERRKRGWPAFEIVGWQEPPHYDDRTNNLTWAIVGKSEEAQSINRIVKLLGRNGVMTVTLVAAPEELAGAAQRADELVDAYRFRPGNTYAEFVPGKDKLAEYGLTALVVGGAGAALVKSGLLAKLWKPPLIALAGIGAAVKRFLFGGRSSQHDPEKPIS